MSFSHVKLPINLPNREKMDPYVTTVAEWIKPFENGDKADIALVGIPLSKSSISFSGAHMHPETFRKLWRSFTTYNIDFNVELSDLKAVDMGDISMHITDIQTCHDRIEETAFEIASQLNETIPIFIGGDHSITFPIIKGIQTATQKRIGVIHFDAHLDVRDTEYGGRSNGTPFRSLLESKVVRGEDIFTLGIRNFANSKAYYEYAIDKGMHIYTPQKIRKDGLNSIIEEAMNHIQAKCDGFYITCDIDSLDQVFVPGVPAIGPSGLRTDELFQGLLNFAEKPNLLGFDIVCVDPSQDVRDISTRISFHAFLQVATGILLSRK